MGSAGLDTGNSTARRGPYVFNEENGAIDTVLIENEQVCLTRWDFPQSGGCTGWHRCEHDYVVVALFGGDLRIVIGAGIVTSSLTTGGSYLREVGVEHDVCIGNDVARSFIKVELLEAIMKG